MTERYSQTQARSCTGRPVTWHSTMILVVLSETLISSTGRWVHGHKVFSSALDSNSGGASRPSAGAEVTSTVGKMPRAVRARYIRASLSLSLARTALSARRLLLWRPSRLLAGTPPPPCTDDAPPASCSARRHRASAANIAYAATCLTPIQSTHATDSRRDRVRVRFFALQCTRSLLSEATLPTRDC